VQKSQLAALDENSVERGSLRVQAEEGEFAPASTLDPCRCQVEQPEAAHLAYLQKIGRLYTQIWLNHKFLYCDVICILNVYEMVLVKRVVSTYSNSF